MDKVNASLILFVSVIRMHRSSRCLKITKSLIQHCERSEVRLHFAVKLVLPDRSILIGQKWVVDAEVQIRHFE